jgi:hypothetical protein
MDFAKCVLTAVKNKQNSANTLTAPAASELSFIIVHLTKI